MIKLWRFLSVSIVLAVCLGLLVVPGVPLPNVAAAAPQNCGMEVVPNTTIKVGFNEPFDVNITLIDELGVDVSDWTVYLEFNSTLLSVTGIDPCETLPSGYAPSDVEGYPTYTAGTAEHMSGVSTADPYWVNQSFVIMTIHFLSLNVEGTSELDLFDLSPAHTCRVINEGGDQLLNWTMVVDGTVTVGLPPVLTVNVTPADSGDVKINGVIPSGYPRYPNTTTWAINDVVPLEAVNSVPGWAFLNWTGNLTGNATPTNITMDDDKDVTANFAEQQPEISPDPTNLTFSGNVGAALANRTLDIYNGGGYTLNWTANITGPNETLFSMSPMNGTNLTAAQYNRTQVAVNTTGLTEGTYYANITINNTDTAENVTVPVTLNLGVPVISATPTSLTFTTSEGEDPPDQTLEICNSGTGTLNWSLSDGGTAWLSESPTSGSLGEDGCEDVTVSVDVSGLAAGDYSATITITGSSEKTVPVTLHIVSAMPELPVEPAQLSASSLSISPQQVQPGQAVTISISVANTGGETGSYNAILYINGVVEDSQSVSVAGGTTKNVIFTVTKSQAGVYDVSVAGQSGQFEVVSTGWFGGGLGTGGIIAIVVVVIILIVAVVFIMRGTRREV